MQTSQVTTDCCSTACKQRDCEGMASQNPHLITVNIITFLATCSVAIVDFLPVSVLLSSDFDASERNFFCENRAVRALARKRLRIISLAPPFATIMQHTSVTLFLIIVVIKVTCALFFFKAHEKHVGRTGNRS